MNHAKNNDVESQVELGAVGEDASTLSALKEGLSHEVEDFVKLELTAEQMLRDEALLVRDYLTNDAKNFWQDLKGELLYMELITGALLLRAADPTRLEWQLGGWWTSRNDAMLH